MRLGKVIGKVWAERKTDSLRGCRLVLVQPVSSGGTAAGRPVVAADPQNLAGAGDTVVFVTNTDAVQAFESADAPVNACIVELVDFID
jgi:ethanolamine utilization protein EutN